ncbi:hypothetical protein ACFL6Y_06215 [Elusimicrobiota bacterium]
MSQTQPYISVVIYARNDDHGGNMLARMKSSVFGFLEQAEKYKLRSELIISEWNPPRDKPRFKDVLALPTDLKYSKVRIITVDPRYHECHKNSDKIFVYGTKAFNVGIRRAQGEFITTGTIDGLFSDELIEFLASGNLDKKAIYRTDRYDVNRDVVKQGSTQEKLEYCKKNVIRVHGKNIEPWKINKAWSMHTNAAGDFVIMSRDLWHGMRGYPEFDLVGLRVDGFLCYIAAAMGAKEIILSEPMRLYHIDHDSVWKRAEHAWLKKMAPLIPPAVYHRLIALIDRIFQGKSKLEKMGLKYISYKEYQDIVIKMSQTRQIHMLNDEDWGLGREKFEEFTVTSS